MAMTALAAVPDATAIIVASRSAASGLTKGIAVILGILLADLVFIAVAFVGLRSVATTFEPVFVVIQLIAILYLLRLAWLLFQSGSKADGHDDITISTQADLLNGFLITLSDPKAILFYLSFLPAYLNLATAGIQDFLLVALAATAALFIVKGSYALLGDRMQALFQSDSYTRRLNLVAATVLLLTAATLAFKLLYRVEW